MIWKSNFTYSHQTNTWKNNGIICKLAYFYFGVQLVYMLRSSFVLFKQQHRFLELGCQRIWQIRLFLAAFVSRKTIFYKKLTIVHWIPSLLAIVLLTWQPFLFLYWWHNVVYFFPFISLLRALKVSHQTSSNIKLMWNKMRLYQM